MSDLTGRVAEAIGCVNPTNCFGELREPDCGCCRGAARRAIEVILKEAAVLIDPGGDIAFHKLEDALK